VTAEASATEESAGASSAAVTAWAPAEGMRAARHARRPSWLTSVLRTARPRQWPKNLLVFAAPLAGATWGRAHGLSYALVALVAFCCASVAVYFVNDVADAERDRQHPRKRYRPVAAGDLPKSHALVIGAACAVVGLAAGVAVSVPLLTAAVGGYMAMSLLYSWVLKHIAVVELIFVASGFLLRVLGGAAATHVPPSGWFLLVCSLGALGVAIAKRFSELAGLGDAAIEHRPVMRWYRPRALLVTQWVIGALMIAAYLAWATGERHSAEVWHILSAIPLAAALVRFAVLTARHTTAPVEDLLMRDGIMLGCELSWLALFVTGLQA
jgi:decaprenyl-phosphate phosphoribosyltransferase